MLRKPRASDAWAAILKKQLNFLTATKLIKF